MRQLSPALQEQPSCGSPRPRFAKVLVFPRAVVSNTASRRAARWDRRGLAKLQLSLQTCKKYGPWGRILPWWLCAAGAQGSLPGSSNPWLAKQLWDGCSQLWGGCLQQAESQSSPEAALIYATALSSHRLPAQGLGTCQGWPRWLWTILTVPREVCWDGEMTVDTCKEDDRVLQLCKWGVGVCVKPKPHAPPDQLPTCQTASKSLGGGDATGTRQERGKTGARCHAAVPVQCCLVGRGEKWLFDSSNSPDSCKHNVLKHPRLVPRGGLRRGHSPVAVVINPQPSRQS